MHSGESKFTTERCIFSFTPNVHTAKQKTPVNGLHADLVSAWTTKYPSMMRPRHSCAAQAIGKVIKYFLVKNEMR